MTSNHAKNEVEVMVLGDLAAICKKLADNSAVPERLRQQAGELVKEHDALVPFHGKGDAAMHFHGESLLIRMARFLPRIVDLQPCPEDASNLLA
jgi:hypothetical protein